MRSLRHLTLISVTIWLLTMPLVMARFHLCTPIAVLLNTVAWLPMAGGLVGGAPLLVTVGSVASPLAHLLRRLLQPELPADGMVRHGGPAHSRQAISGSPVRPIGGCGAFMAAWACWPRFRGFVRPGAGRAALLAGWIAVGFTAAAWPHHRDRLDCTFLSMGHGCAVLLELAVRPDDALRRRPVRGAVGGHARHFRVALVARQNPPRRRGALPCRHRPLQRLAGTAGKVFGGARSTSRRSCSRRRTTRWPRCEPPSIGPGVPIREVCARATGFGAAKAACWKCSTRRGTASSAPTMPTASCLSVEYRGRRILLPGDLEPPGLDDVLAEEPRPCDVLMAPHHGSRQSNSPELAAWCTAALGRVQRRRALEPAGGRSPLSKTRRPGAAHLRRRGDRGADRRRRDSGVGVRRVGVRRVGVRP